MGGWGCSNHRQLAALRSRVFAMTVLGQRELFSPAEMGFLAKEETITIMPKVRVPELQFLVVRDATRQHLHARSPTHHNRSRSLPNRLRAGGSG